MNHPPPADRPTVLLYRSEILPYSQTFITSQARAMRHHRPVLVGTSRTGDAGTVDGIDVEIVRHRPGALRAPWRPEGPPFETADIERLAALAPVLVHAHFGADGFAAAPLAAALGIPLVVTFHGQDATRTASFAEDWRQWGYERRIPLLARRAAHVIAVSNHIRRRLATRGVPEAAMSVQRIGVDTRWLTPPLAPREEGLIVAVGRLVEKKGFSVLAEALERVAVEHPGVRLVILGDGPEHAALAAAPAAAAGRLELRGAVAPDEVRDWLRLASVVAVPSLTAADGDTEGLPTVVVEAMACGAAVVASAHAGIPEAVADGLTGNLVPEGNALALASALSRLLADAPRREAYGRAARARAVQEFDLANRTADLEDLYRQVAAFRPERAAK